MAPSSEIGVIVLRAAAALREAGAAEVYVFGSAGAGRGDSDIDLAVRGLPGARFFRAMARAAVAAGRPIDLVDLDEDSAFTRYLGQSGELRRVA